MDQMKIGTFIAQRRKQANLTQLQLADRLGITDKAVSKWERGLAMPDSSIMLELCNILGITVGDLLSGEVVTVDHYKEQLENNLLEMVKQKELAEKRLLSAEVFIGLTATIVLFSMVLLAAFLQIATEGKVALIVLGFLLFFAGCLYALRLEQVAGYYECKECTHQYVPTFKAMTFAPHMGRTRYMRCPQCGQKSWQKKVISKE